MLRAAFVWKLYLSYALLILFTAGTVGLFVAARLEEETRNDIRLTLEAEARLLGRLARQALVGPQRDGLKATVTDVGGAIGSRLTVIQADGAVIADSRAEPGYMENHSDRPEVIEALAGSTGVGTSVRPSSTLGKSLMYVAVRIGDAGSPLGVARAALPLDAVERRLADVRSGVLSGAILAVVAGLAIGLVFARRFTRPLESLTLAAESLARGGHLVRAEVSGRDEVGRLGEAFNAMAQSLERRVETISEDRNKLGAVLGSMVEGVIAVDLGGRVLHLNRAAAGILGLRGGAPVGSALEAIVRVPELHDILTRTRAAGESHGVRIKVLLGGREVTLDLIASPLVDANAHVAGAVVVLHDVTELQRLETVRRDFVANVSHELKTPLTAVRGIVDTLLDDPEMEEGVRRHFLERVQDQTQRLTALVADLLLLSRAEAGNLASAPQRIDLREQALESFRSLEQDARKKHLTYESRIPERPIIVSGDPEALRQVVDNLLVNAIRYTPEGGWVRLDLGIEGNQAVIEIADTGIGIPSEDQERVFERFYRVDKARSRALGGTGLGLSIVKHLVNAHRGSIDLVSTLGEGSRFRVRLPLSVSMHRTPEPGVS